MNTQKYDIGDTLFRHGDVMLKKTDRPLRKDATASSRVVLHAGQNHDHVLQGCFGLYEDRGRKFVEVLQPCTLDHDEHGPLELAPSDTALEVDIQVEYDHFLEESRAVID